jgi:hypothetical protein
MSLVDSLWESAGAPINDEFFGVSIVYSRGTQSVTVTAIPSVIAPTGQVFRPKRADTIVETVNGVECKYEVCPLPDKPLAELQLGAARWLVRAKRVE